MRPYRRQIALFLFTSLMASAALADFDPETLASRLRSSIVALTVKGEPRLRQEDRSDETTFPAVRRGSSGIAAASGLLISADGLVLTVASLLDTSGEVTATFEGGGAQRAEIVGKDARLGLALLRVRGAIPGFVSLKDIGMPTLGERMVALGRVATEDATYPMLSEGIISAVGDATPRTLPFVQSTVQLAPIMGGGPLVSQKTGDVVGVNYSILVTRNGGVTMTFAIPIRAFLKVKEQLITKGRVVRPSIGVSLAAITDEIRFQLAMTGKDGVVITAVREGSPAALAGLQRGDVVTRADGAAIGTVVALFDAIAAGDPGDMLQLIVFRNGRSITFNVKRGELPEQ